METTEILENNKLIAEFMGFRETFIRNVNGKKYDYVLPNGFELIKEVETTIESVWCEVLEEQDNCFAEDLKFTKSWDWLMPVVEKIEKLNTVDEFEIKWDSITKNNYCEILPALKDFIFHVQTVAKTKITAVYQAVIEFIKWYNENK